MLQKVFPRFRLFSTQPPHPPTPQAKQSEKVNPLPAVPADSKNLEGPPRETCSSPIPPKVLELAEQIVNLSYLELAMLDRAMQKRLGFSDEQWHARAFGSGVSTGRSIAASQGAAETSSGSQNAKSEKKYGAVVITGFDDSKKIAVIKELRKVTTLGLKEAKEKIEKLPCIVKEQVPTKEGEELVRQLTEVGATVTFKQ